MSAFEKLSAQSLETLDACLSSAPQWKLDRAYPTKENLGDPNYDYYMQDLSRYIVEPSLIHSVRNMITTKFEHEWASVKMDPKEWKDLIRNRYGEPWIFVANYILKYGY